MTIYTLTRDAAYLGERHETYGWSVWCETDKGPVMFNTQTQNILAGTQITAQDYEDKTSAKGKPYKRLKKVSIGEPAPAGTPETPSGEEVLSKLNAIQGDLKLVLSFMRQLQKEQDKSPEDGVVDVDPEEGTMPSDFLQ